MKNLRTQLALKIAPWLKPGEPVAREWKVSGPHRLQSSEAGYVPAGSSWTAAEHDAFEHAHGVTLIGVKYLIEDCSGAEPACDRATR